MKPLNWIQRSPTWFTASGRRGHYTIRQREDGLWLLFGITHEGWSLLIPESCRTHPNPTAAQHYAAEMEKHPEPEMSGT